MYLIVIGWMYVVLMMSVAEATNSNGTLLGAMFTFVLYGLGPVTLVVYLMGSPARSKAIKRRGAQEIATQTGSARQTAGTTGDSVEPDTGGHASSRAEAIAVDTAQTGIAPVRKEP